MDLLNDRVDKLYFRFLLSAMGSAVVISIYSFVDTIAIGKAESEAGSAAMAVLLPYFAIMSFLAVLCGMGGAVLMSQAFGEGNKPKGQRYFTVSCMLMGLVMVFFWTLSIAIKDKLFLLFGASEEMLPKVMEYGNLLTYCFPLFVYPNFLGCFVRNDKAPVHVMSAVILGGIVNIIGDIVFVFPMKMGMFGAALATVTGAAVQSIVMTLHLFKKRSNLHFVKPVGLSHTLLVIATTGFSAGILELGTVVISCVMNNQIMKYGTNAHLAVFGIISTIAALWQALFSGVGLAVQPISSANYGARKPSRIRKTLFLGASSILLLGTVFTLIGELLPVQTIKLFMTATPDVIAAAPRMTRLFSIWYFFLGINALGVYYLQAISQARLSFILAALRSVVLSVLFMYLLPLSLGFDGVMLSLPISEAIVSLLTIASILVVHRKYFKPIWLADFAYNESYCEEPATTSDANLAADDMAEIAAADSVADDSQSIPAPTPDNQ